MEPGNQIKNRVRSLAVKVSGRLIRQQDFGLGDERAGQSYSLLFSPGKFAGAMMRTRLKSHFAQPLRSFCFDLLPGLPSNQERHGHVFQRRKFRQQVVELPYEADFAVTKIGGVIFGERIQSQVGAVYVTCGSTIKGAEDVQEGTLSRTRFAHDGDHFSLGYVERQIFKEHQIRFAGAKNLLQTLNPQRTFVNL